MHMFSIRRYVAKRREAKQPEFLTDLRWTMIPENGKMKPIPERYLPAWEALKERMAELERRVPEPGAQRERDRES